MRIIPSAAATITKIEVFDLVAPARTLRRLTLYQVHAHDAATGHYAPVNFGISPLMRTSLPASLAGSSGRHHANSAHLCPFRFGSGSAALHSYLRYVSAGGCHA